MFFCNPYKETENRKEGDDGDAMQVFRFLIRHPNLPWISSLEASKSSLGLKPAASFSTGSASSSDSSDDFVPSATMMFHDASSDAIFRQSIQQSTSASGKTTHFQRMNLTRFSELMILLLCCMMTLGILLVGPHSGSMNALDLSVIKDSTTWIKSSAMRIWNGAVPSTNTLIEIVAACIGVAGKIPWAISSLFQWDEVDDAIIDWTKRAILMVPKSILRIGSETLTSIYPALPTTQSVTTTVSRRMLRIMHHFSGSAPGSQQALALLDFLQDEDL